MDCLRQRACFSAGAVLAGSVLAWAQAAGAATQGGGVGELQGRKAADRMVVLDVVAESPSAMDLRMTDNGAAVAPERVQVVAAGDGGTESQIVLVIDAVNSTPEEVTRSEAAVEECLKSARGGLSRPTSVIVLSDAVAEHGLPTPNTETAALHQRQLFAHRIPATTDASSLIEALRRYKLGLHRILEAQAGAGQAERVRLSLEAMSFVANAERAEPGAKVVVWMSPGWPFLARAEASSSQQIFDSIVYFSDLLRSARMMVFAVDPRGVTPRDSSAQMENFLLTSRPGANRTNGRAQTVPVEVTDDYYRNFLGGVRTVADANPNDLTLQVLAYQSGGLVLEHNNDLRAQIAMCVADANRLVSVRYVPDSAAGAGTYHAIEVKAAGGSRALRTRSGFYLR